jgi:hypothetical protein
MAFLNLLAALSLSASLTVPVIFTAGAAVPSNSVLVANPNAAAADGASAVVLTFTAKDAQKNVVPGLSVSFTASGTGNAFGTASATTNANGQISTTLTSTVAQNETIFANFSGGAAVSTVVVFASGPASAATSSLVVNPNSTVANNSNTLTAVLTLRDAQGNPIAGATPTFSASGPSTTVAASGNTLTSGQASANYQTAVAQNENAVVTAAGVTMTAPMSFVAGPATAAASTLTASPNIVAGNNTASMSLLATARDAQGNPVSNVSVAFSASGGNNTFGSANGMTLGDGTYTTSLKSRKMQTETITAVIAGSVNETVSVTFTGNANATTSTLAVSPNAQTVGPNYNITATLTLRDAASNPLSGVTPAWTGSGQNNTIISSGTTSSAGIGTATYSSTLAQNENIQVAAGGVSSLYQSIAFVADSPNATLSYMYAIPGRQVANNSNTIVASVMLFDAYGNGVSGQVASFTASGSNTTVSGPSSTSSTGLAQATYKTATVQNQNAVVSAAGLNLRTPIVFTDVPSQCLLTVNPNSQAADGNSAMSLTATVTNSAGQPVPNVQIIFSSTGAAQTFSGQNLITSGSGQATTNLTSFYAGTNNLLARAANVQCASQGNFLSRTAYCVSNPNYNTRTYITSNSPQGAVAGDFNGDGKQDLAIVNYGSNSLGIFLGIGAGQFQSQITYPTSSSPSSVAIGDFNGDGMQDLAVSNSGSNNLSVHLGNGAGSFQYAFSYPTGSNPQNLAVGDFNGDGKQDLAVVNNTANTLGILLGTGIGKFQAQVTYATGDSPVDLTVGDFNGDGMQDLVVLASGNDTLSLFLGTGTGLLQAPNPYATGTYPQGITVGDFDGDGRQDVAIVNNNDSTLGIFLGTGTGTFQAQVTYPTGTNSGPFDVTTGDFNGDGVQDLAVANGFNYTLGLFLGTGVGTFRAQLTYPTGNQPTSLATGDFNSDGKQDVVVTNYSSNNLRVYLTACP